jgi:putative ABC transport system substrate-binding protein
MRRRELITLLGGAAAAWPLAVRAQQPAKPMIGWLGTGSPEADAYRVTSFRKGLSETGHAEGRSVATEFRWAHGQYDRLPMLATDLVERQVSLIFAGPLPATMAAKAATATIPIVFANGNDPIVYGLVASFNRPGGNVTGVSFLVNLLVAKQLELLHETVPNAAMIGVLVNPNNPNAGIDTKQILTAADKLGQKLLVVNASTPGEIEAAFSTVTQKRVGALLIHPDAFFTSRYEQLATLTARHAIPTIYYFREFTAAGGLMSYGASITDAHRQAGIYAGRILKGEKPADLPVQQATKVELVINLKTAKGLGITFPLSLLGRADEVIE